jgi:hypothetical protein
MRRETDGYLEAWMVKRFAESPHAEMAVSELVAVGWWSIEGQGYRIHHHMEHQPEVDVIVKRRALEAERQRKHRRKKAGLADGDDNRHGVTQRVTPRVTRNGTERNGSGELQDQLRQEQEQDWEPPVERGSGLSA